MTWKKKLINVAPRLDGIDREAAPERSIVHAYPCTLHRMMVRLGRLRAIQPVFLSPDGRGREVPRRTGHRRSERVNSKSRIDCNKHSIVWLLHTV